MRSLASSRMSELITINPRGAESVTSVHLSTRRLEGNQPKPRKNGDNSAAALLKNSQQLGCVFQVREPPGSRSTLWKGTHILKPTRKVKFSVNAPRHMPIREKRGPWRGVIPEVQTKEEATVYVKELVLFVTVELFEDTPVVHSPPQPRAPGAVTNSRCVASATRWMPRWMAFMSLSVGFGEHLDLLRIVVPAVRNPEFTDTFSRLSGVNQS